MFEALNFAGRTVAGQNDLLVTFVQRVECVEKFFLNAFLAGEKLDVVNEEHVGLAVFLAELGELVVLDAVNVFVGEFLGRKVGDRAPFLFAECRNLLADGVKQMRLSQPDTAIKKQRVVGFSGSLGNGLGSCIGEIVVVADDERIKRVLGIEMRLAIGRHAFVNHGGCFCLRRRRGRCRRPGTDLNLICNWRPAAMATASCNKLK